MTLSYADQVFAHAANRAKVHPQYLGWVLARYRELENLSERDLVEILGSTKQDFLRLGLCLRPRAEHFPADLEQISMKFNSDAVALAKIVRFVESLEAMTAAETGTVSGETGLLIAARTRKKPHGRHNKQAKKEPDDDESAP